MLPVPVEHGDVYASILIARPESQPCRRVKEIRIEDYGAILSIRDVYSSRLLLLQKGFNNVRTTVVRGEVPGERSVHVVNDEPARCLVQVGVLWRDPEIHVHRREVGMSRRACREILVVLEAPQLSERVSVDYNAR